MNVTWREYPTTYPDPDPREEVCYRAEAGDYYLSVIFDVPTGRWYWRAHHKDGTLHDGHADSLAAAQEAAKGAIREPAG